MLRRVLGLKRIFGYEIRPNRELATLFNDPNIVAILKSQRIRWAKHIWRAEGQHTRTVTEWRPNKSRSR